MAAPATADEFLQLLRRSQIIETGRLDAALRDAPADVPKRVAAHLVAAGALTPFQAEQLLAGKWRGFTLGKYRLLDRIGTGGMGQVFLAEHAMMQRRVALKVLPPTQAKNPSALERFMREARAAGSLAHPNIVRAYDIDQAGELHFIVMEFVDGASFHQMVKAAGPMAPERAAQYLWQAAVGLQHAHEAGLVHRDIKPANLIVDRQGVVKLLDLGLARFFHDDVDGLTQQHDGQQILGTADYLAPEQGMDSHDVDTRADIYALGATGYFLLTGQAPFESGSAAQKIIAHQLREPKPISEFRADVPPELLAVLKRMTAKNPDERYQTPAEVALALDAWGRVTLPPPSERELPRLCAALATPSSMSTGSSGYSGIRAAAMQAMRAGPSSTSQAPSPSTRIAADATQSYPPVAKRPRGPWPWLVGLAALVAIAVGSYSFGTYRTLAKKVEPPPAVAVKPAETVPTTAGGRDLFVRTAARTGEYPSVRAAILASRSGDRVVLVDAELRESLSLSASEVAGRATSIVGRLASGEPVVWRAPSGAAATQPLLQLEDVGGLTISGVRFDGEGRQTDLVTVRGTCPGLTFDTVQFTAFGRAGLALNGAAGSADRPMRFERLRSYAPVAGAEAAIALRATSRPVAHVRLLDSRLEGPARAALMARGEAEGIELERCRIWQATDGVVVERGGSPAGLMLTVRRCTFAEVESCVQFQALPVIERSRVTFQDNLAVKTVYLAMLQGLRQAPVTTPAQWIWHDEPGDLLRDAPIGTRLFRRLFELPAPVRSATLDAICDDEFTARVNGQMVGKFRSSSHTRRVVAYDVTAHLKPGRNVLTVSGTNLANTNNALNGAALLVRLRVTLENGSLVEIVSDGSWKSFDGKLTGWTDARFDDSSWSAARVLLPYGKPPYAHCHWDSEIAEQIGNAPAKLFPEATGNARDTSKSRPSPFVPEVRTNAFGLPLNPADDATFLRYPPDGPLADKMTGVGAP